MELKDTDELKHYGVKGMKWGVRRYQNKDGSLTAQGKSRYSSNSSSKNFIEKVYNKKVSSLPKAGSVETQALLLSTVAAYYISKSSRKSLTKKYSNIANKSRKACLKDMDLEYKYRLIDNLKSAPKIKSKESTNTIAKKVNKGYPEHPGRRENNIFCTAAMAMREKGYDVYARSGFSKNYYSDDFFKKTFNSKTIKPKKTSSTELLNELQKNGVGSYGNLTVNWKLGGGHSLFWKNDNGKIRIFDSLSGEEYSINESSYKQFFNSIDIRKSEYNRLDNVDPTEYVLGSLDYKIRNDIKEYKEEYE